MSPNTPHRLDGGIAGVGSP